MLGERPFIDDMTVPGMLRGAFLFSPLPAGAHPPDRRRRRGGHARCGRGSSRRPTCRASGSRGSIYKDWPIFVAEGEDHALHRRHPGGRRGRHRGARPRRRGAASVESDELPGVFSPEEALAPDAPRVHANHDNLLSRRSCAAATSTPRSRRRRSSKRAPSRRSGSNTRSSNRSRAWRCRLGTRDSGLGTWDMVAHAPCPMSLRLEVFSQGQGVFDDRRQIASILGVPDDRRAGHARLERRRLRRQGRPEHPGPGRADGVADRAAREGHAHARGEHPAAPETPPDHDDLHRGVRRGGAPDRRPRAHDRRQGRVRVGRHQGARTRRGPRVRPVQGAGRRRRGARRLHEQPALRRDARLRRQPGGLRHRRHAGHPGRTCRASIAGRSAGATPSTWATRSAPARSSNAGVGLKQTLLAVKDAYRGRARWPGIACGIKNVGIGNGMPESGPGHRRRAATTADSCCTAASRRWARGSTRPWSSVSVTAPASTPTTCVRDVSTAFDTPCGMTTASRATVLGGRAARRAGAQLRADLDRGLTRAELAGRRYVGEFLASPTTALERGRSRIRARTSPSASPRRSASSTTPAASNGSSPRTTSAASSTATWSRARSKAPCTWASGTR